MRKYILLAIIVLATLLRVIALDSHMPALYGDEISIGYNAYSVLKTGHDEFNKFLPLQFESWGDQKNPVYIYLVALLQILFGLSEWSVRLPSALAGVAAVYLTYCLTKKILNNPSFPKEHMEPTALISSALLAINPWHIHISRGGYESNLALTLGLLAVLGLVKYLENTSWRYFVISLLSATLAMYTYYTTKLFLPLLLFLVFYYSKPIIVSWRAYLHRAARYFIIFALLCLPIVYLALFSHGQARFQTINIFANPTVENRVVTARTTYQSTPTLAKFLENKYIYYLRDFLEYYFDNFSGQLLYVSGDSSLRYAMRDHGMFYLIEAPFFLLGLAALYSKNRRLWLFLLLWLLLAPLPTALVGRAYGLRSLAMLPIPLIFTGGGIVSAFFWIKQRHPSLQLFATGSVILLFGISLTNWLVRYIFFYPVYGQYWYDGMQKEMIQYAKSEENNYDHIILSRYYGKTEMYYSFYQKIPPSSYQRFSTDRRVFANTSMVQSGKYYFGDLQYKGEDFNSLPIPDRTLIIAAPNAPFGNETIKAKDDGRVLFKVIKKQ